MRLTFFLAWMVFLLTTKNMLAQQNQKKPIEYVGEIKIVGNTITQDRVIRGQLKLYPGQVLDRFELKASENRLTKLGLFKVDAFRKIGPTVKVLDSDCPYKDILVMVEENSKQCFKLACNGDKIGPPAIYLLLEDLNFDLGRFPTSFSDIREGKAFRGGGQKVRLEILRLTLLDMRITFLGGGRQILPLAVRSFFD